MEHTLTQLLKLLLTYMLTNQVADLTFKVLKTYIPKDPHA